MAPSHTMVPILMDNLFNWMNNVKEDVNPLILSSIFHYEFVFIHPFQMEMEEQQDYGKQQYFHIGKICLNIFQ